MWLVRKIIPFSPLNLSLYLSLLMRSVSSFAAVPTRSNHHSSSRTSVSSRRARSKKTSVGEAWNRVDDARRVTTNGTLRYDRKEEQQQLNVSASSPLFERKRGRKRRLRLRGGEDKVDEFFASSQEEEKKEEI